MEKTRFRKNNQRKINLPLEKLEKINQKILIKVTFL